MTSDRPGFVRFALEQRKLKSPSRKKTLYLPPNPAEGQERELSVFSTHGATRQDLQEAAAYVATEQNRPVYGGLVAGVEAYEREKLSLCPNTLQFGGSVHTNVRGWPAEKETRLEIARRLVQASCTCVLEKQINPAAQA